MIILQHNSELNPCAATDMRVSYLRTPELAGTHDANLSIKISRPAQPLKQTHYKPASSLAFFFLMDNSGTKYLDFAQADHLPIREMAILVLLRFRSDVPSLRKYQRHQTA
jgi:hypothetical protein